MWCSCIKISLGTHTDTDLKRIASTPSIEFLEAQIDILNQKLIALELGKEVTKDNRA